MRSSPPVWQSMLFTLVFAGLFGIAIGVPLLLDGLVPFENWLRVQSLSQPEIDSVLGLVLTIYALFVLGIAVLVHYLVQGKERRPAIGALLLLSCALFAGINLRQLLLRGAPVLARSSEFQLREQRFNFGPYPDEVMMRQLNRSGVRHVITLLNPALPFEAALLADEQMVGPRYGLTIHSFPMLPWVSGNEEQLGAALQLVESLPGERFYVHCYLGKHRVALLETMLSQEVDSSWADQPWPDAFERGAIRTFAAGRVVTGPMPTPEEWLELRTRQVRQVFCLLDLRDKAQTERIAEAKGYAAALGIEFVQLDRSQSDAELIRQTMQLLTTSSSKCYLFDFSESELLRILQGRLEQALSTP